MQGYALIGRSLRHSLSSEYFALKFKRLHLSATYTNYELVHIDMLSALLAAHPELRGFNVTIPYKEAILPYLCSLTPEAHRAGAVNTVAVCADGLHGHNTDIIGFGNALDEFLAGTHPEKALILGTGGASKAVAAALSQRNIPYEKVSRTEGKCRYSYSSLTSQVIASSRLIVNCTPLGTTPDVSSKPSIDYSALSSGHFAFDLVYNPASTAFMQSCRNQGAKVCNGLNMLHLQAEEAWRWWQSMI